MADLLTNAQLAQLINDALSKWNAREAEQYAWVSGSATGGPNGDGRYPLSNGSGGSSLIDSPAKLADLLNGPAALAGAARDAALTFRDAAQSAATAASTDKTLANNHKLAAQDARDLAAQYRNEIAALLPGFNANASMVQAASLAVAADVDLMEALLEEGYVARDAAVTAQTAAEAAAALAATFNPNDYYTKVAADGRYLQLTNFTWANLSGKPSTFAPSAHTHLISEITGLQTALDGKQAAGSYAAAVHSHDYLPLSGGTLTGGLAVAGDITASRSASEGVLYLSSSGTKYLRYGDGVYGLAGADLYINGNLAWHGGNFSPSSKSDVGHTHIIGNITGLQDALNEKVSRSNTGVRFGVLPYKAALWVADGSDGTGIGGWARSFAIQAGSNSTHGGFFTAYGGDTQATEVRIGVGTVDTGYTQSNALCISSTGMTWANNAVWHGGNFDPNSKLNTSGGSMNGTLTMSSSPIVMSFSGSLPYLDMQTTGVANGRNYRIRSGIEGVSNAGFSIRDLSNGSNPLYIYDNGVVTTPGGIWSNHIGYNPAGDGFTLGNGWVANYGMSLGEHGGNGTGLATVLSGYSGLRLVTQAATRLAITTGGNVGIGVDGSGNDSALRVVSPSGAGLRVGFYGTAENYYDSGYHAFRHTTGAAILEMYPSTIYARQDLYATSGNIFVRENPSGAGAGMRLHHSGGGAYIDYDGNLNFRNGEGSGIASLNSDGAFIASNVIGTEQLRVGGYTSATGFMNFSNGNAGNPGYAAWYTADGVRRGYMGWSEGSNIVYQAENGWGLKFNSTVTFGGLAQFYSFGNPQTDSGPSLQAYGGGGSNGAWMAFHRPNNFAINMGLDSSNVFRIGGWSASADLFQLDMSGNLTVKASVKGFGIMHLQSYGASSAMGAYLSLKDNSAIERGWIGYGENTTRMRVRNSVGEVMVHGTTVTLYSDNSGGQTRIGNDVGNTYIGSVNSSWSHFSTDRPAFYFQNAVHFDGAPMRYTQGAMLHHDSSSMGSGKITTSTAAPSGGSDGDVWFKVA